MGGEQSTETSSRLIFTGGQDGDVRVWSIPDLPQDEKFPTTDGNNFCLGVWGENKDSVLQLDYHSFLPLLMCVKNNSKVEFWDCQEIIESKKTVEQKPRAICESPKEQSVATCGCWLPTDSNLCVVAFSDSRSNSCNLSFFDYKSG